MPTWTWRYEDAESKVVQLTETPDVTIPDGFAAQADAESWIGEHWRLVLAAGVESAYLLLDGATVYGPLSLRPAL